MFLRDLLAEIDAVSLAEVKNPCIPVGEDEKVLGTLPDELKKLYTIYMRALDQEEAAHAEFTSRANALIDATPISKLSSALTGLVAANAIPIRHQCSVLKIAFWRDVEIAFPETTGEDCMGAGIRVDWQVVALPMPKAKSPTDLSSLNFLGGLVTRLPPGMLPTSLMSRLFAG